METGAIKNHANRHFEQASSFKRSMEDLRREIRAAKAEQKLHRFRGLHLVVNATLSPSNRPNPQLITSELRAAHRLNNLARDQERKVLHMDRRVQSAIGKAHVLINLARRANGGHIYAKHQADIMLGRQ